MIGMSMIRLISKICDNRIKMALKVIILLPFAFTSCEKPIQIDGSVPVALTFTPTFRDATTRTAMRGTKAKMTKATTRATNTAGNYFSKLNIQMFNAAGEKVFDKVKTQTKDDDDFGTFSLKLKPGTYWIVAVGHSSKNSATIKSPEAVQFTASDGEKLTDTFCHCSQITIGEDAAEFTLPMYRVGAMIQFCLTDTQVPDNFAYFIMEYTGGSANFNPTTLEGITKSSQSEKRIRNEWRSFLANKKKEQGMKPEDVAKMFEAAFAKMFR